MQIEKIRTTVWKKIQWPPGTQSSKQQAPLSENMDRKFESLMKHFEYMPDFQV